MIDLEVYSGLFLAPDRMTDVETLRDWTCFDADSGKDLAVEVREYFIPAFPTGKTTMLLNPPLPD